MKNKNSEVIYKIPRQRSKKYAEAKERFEMKKEMRYDYLMRRHFTV